MERSCQRVIARLHRWRDDDVDAIERDELIAHFVACPHCRRERELYDRIVRALGRVTIEDPPPAVLDRISHRVMSALATRRPRPSPVADPARRRRLA